MKRYLYSFAFGLIFSLSIFTAPPVRAAKGRNCEGPLIKKPGRSQAQINQEAAHLADMNKALAEVAGDAIRLERGAIVLDLKNAEDAAKYQIVAKNVLLDSIKILLGAPGATKVLLNSLRETRMGSPKAMQIRYRGLNLQIGNPAGQASINTPALLFHSGAVVLTQVIMDPEKLYKSLNDIRSLDDLQTQREWMAVELLQDSAQWPNHRLPDEPSGLRFDALENHIKQLTTFDRAARKIPGYANPFHIFENIGLCKIWVEQRLIQLQTKIQADELRMTFANPAEATPTLLNAALGVHLNMYQLWSKAQNPTAKKNLAGIVDSAQLLAESIYLAMHPGEDLHAAAPLKALYAAESVVHAPLMEAPVALAEAAPDQATAPLSAEAFPKAETPVVETLAAPLLAAETSVRLAMAPNGTLDFPKHQTSGAWVLHVEDQSTELTPSEWTVQLDRGSRKEWTQLEKFSNAKEKLFFRRMNEALGAILLAGYPRAIAEPGFPEVKQIHVEGRDRNAFELRIGLEGRVVYRIDKTTRTLTITSLSHIHNVDYR